MAFEMANDVSLPTATTVASYTAERLGQSPTLRARYTETVSGGTNDLGWATQIPASTGRSWELALTTVTPAHKAKMEAMLGTIAFKLIKSALAALGNTSYTDSQIHAILSSIENVDSLIATECENLEKERRAGTIDLVAIGQAPAPSV